MGRPYVRLNNIPFPQEGYVPPNSKDEVNEIIEGSKPGTIAFNTPRSLPLGKEATIKVRVSTRKSIPELKRMINAVGEIVGEEIEVHKVMDASLTGTPGSFRIEPVTEEVQVVRTITDNEWRWTVIPLKIGVQRLNLTLSGVISVENTQAYVPHEVFNRDIEIRVDEILKPLKEAEIIFDLPANVQIGEPSIVELRVSPQESVGIANNMAVRLTGGSGLKIKPITDEIQPVSETVPGRWKWEIIPLRAGSHPLNLVPSALIDIPGDPTPQRIPVNFETDRQLPETDRQLEVQEVRVPWSERVSSFMKDNWQWLWAAILVPLGALLWPIVRNLFLKFVLKRR
jgi:hypothetical protein